MKKLISKVFITNKNDIAEKNDLILNLAAGDENNKFFVIDSDKSVYNAKLFESD